MKCVVAQDILVLIIGSNMKGKLETTAVYDLQTEEFVMQQPNKHMLSSGGLVQVIHNNYLIYIHTQRNQR